ncbi:hypothetical protein LHGZ1_2137 [Laribacter hongkongensis]|uniref:Uncharacterized protein n=1 Tax=Laribacter hongkongensis TaxID=168471 RepID=A0A248LJQ0_9NEIS|nr:hypothetical protein LHGZ1_2137 [Laribacter hongkongensis]
MLHEWSARTRPYCAMPAGQTLTPAAFPPLPAANRTPPRPIGRPPLRQKD